jgi:hypothetical protein
MKRLMVYGGQLCLAVAALAALIAPARAQARIWTATGSTGTVDEADLDKVHIAGDKVTLTTTPAGARAVIRYNVVAVGGLFAPLTPASWPALTVCYNDDGDGERLVARLKEYDLATGALVTRITFDSDLYPPQNGFQTRAIGDCGVFAEFDFAAKAYFIEVELINISGVDRPVLSFLALSRYGVCRRMASRADGAGSNPLELFC